MVCTSKRPQKDKAGLASQEELQGCISFAKAGGGHDQQKHSKLTLQPF